MKFIAMKKPGKNSINLEIHSHLSGKALRRYSAKRLALCPSKIGE